jgi:hypothetical protein
MSRILCVASVPVKPTRKTPRPEAPFGLGIEAPLIEAWTDACFLFVLTEPGDVLTGRYRLDVYVDGRLVDTRHYDDGYGPQHAKADASAMATEHAAIHRAYVIERFERWMETHDRLPAPICGGAPERPEATDEDRRWWAETSDRETRRYAVRRGRGQAGVDDSDVVVATGCCG